MTKHLFVLRHMTLWTLASISLAFAFSTSSRAATQDPEPPVDEQKTERAPAGDQKDAGLVVVVTGNGKPIAQADVKIKFPPSIGGEASRPTNDLGEAEFHSRAPGIAKIRVIATGWMSVLQEVKLKKGTVRLKIELVPLPNPEPP